MLHAALALVAMASQDFVSMGPYRAQLRIPAEGLYAGEEMDLEFRVTDTRSKDEVEEGYKGVGGIETTAEITMPAMPGMPVVRPKVHREGVPGDYGVEAYFPHGGQYQLALKLKFQNGEVHQATFLMSVRDERDTKPVRPPYYLKIDGNQGWIAGKARSLQLRVINSKTGLTQKTFDVAHEKRMHLLIASKDLNWFRHEHPVMDANGMWSLPFTFPAGGRYWVYGDVAPSGEGSRILIANLEVAGPKPSWNTKILMNRKAHDGINAELVLPTIRMGQGTSLMVKLTQNGKPVGDTEPYLGAAGHMMIFHQDGLTVVHSHPKEDEASERLVKQGTLQFSARFPRKGVYKVYTQVQWHGKVRTFGFGMRVK